MVSLAMKMTLADLLMSLALICTKHDLSFDYTTYIEQLELIIDGNYDY